LKGAGTVDSVLAVVGQFLAEWKPEEIALLPSDCWPTQVTSRKHVIDCASRLSQLHADFQGDANALARLQELLLFFTHVSVRITQVERLVAGQGVAAAPAFLDTDPTGSAAGSVLGKKRDASGDER
jgi:hypothetical protein